MKRRTLIGLAATTLCVGLGFGIGFYLQLPPGPLDTSPGSSAERRERHREYPSAAPPLRLRVVAWDFGTSPPGREKNRSFEITNSSAEPWTLKHLTFTCSCLKAELSAKTIRPGDTAKLEVAYRAPRRDGRASGHIMVEFSEPTSPILQLMIEAEVRGLLSADPPSLVFDYSPPGSRPSQTVTLRNHGEGHIAITRVEAPEWLQTEVRPVERPDQDGRPRQAWELVVQLNSGKLPPASGSATLAVHTDSEQVGSAFIDVSVKPALEASPDRLTFDTAASRKNGLKVALRVAPGLGELTEKELVLTHNLGDELDVQVHKASPHLFILLVRFQPKGIPGEVAGELEIRTPKATVPAVRVKVSGTRPHRESGVRSQESGVRSQQGKNK